MVHIGMDENMSSQSNDVNSENIVDGVRSEDKAPKVQYTIPGVLHYVQHEWAKFEMERSQWEVERAELQARIAFLQGERKGQENLKNDLVRRIKMLEYALKQERLKNHRLLHGNTGDADVTDSGNAEETSSMLQQVTIESDSITTQPNSNTYWREGRQLLRKYLEEVGFTDTILDVRSYRVRSLLGLKADVSNSNVNGKQLIRDNAGNIIEARPLRDVVTSEHPVLSSMNFGGTSTQTANDTGTLASKIVDQQDSDNEDDTATVYRARKSSTKGISNYALEEEEALAEFQFLTSDEATQRLRNNKTSPTSTSSSSSSSGGGVKRNDPVSLEPTSEDWGVDYSVLNKKKEMYQKEAMTKKGASHSRLPRSELQAMITALNDDRQGGQQQQQQQFMTDKQQGAMDSLNKCQQMVPPNAGGDQYFANDLTTAYGRLTLGDLSALSGVDEADPVTHSVNGQLRASGYPKRRKI